MSPDQPLDSDLRLRRIRYRAWKRGTREMDLVMGRFVDAEMRNWSEAELAEFERLIDEPDNDLLDWVLGRAEPPDAYQGGLLARMKAFNEKRNQSQT